MDDVVVAGSVVEVVDAATKELLTLVEVEHPITPVVKKQFGTRGGIVTTDLGVVVNVLGVNVLGVNVLATVVVVVVVVVNTVLASSQAALANVVAPLTFISDRIVKHMG